MKRAIVPLAAVLSVLTACLIVAWFGLPTRMETDGQQPNLPVPDDPATTAVEGKLVSEWVAALSSDDEMERKAAVAALRHAPASAWPVVVPAFRHAKSFVREAAIAWCGEHGDKAAGAVPALTELLTDPEASVRAKVLEALDALGEPGVAGLAQALRHDDREVRRRAVALLREKKSSTASALPELKKALDDLDEEVRWSAAAAMAKAGRTAVPDLVAALRHPDREVRRLALAGLTANRVPAKTSIPEIDAALDLVAIARVRYWFVLALEGKKDCNEALPKVLEAMQNEDEALRYAAFEALCQMGSKARPALAQVKAALNDPDDAIRGKAHEALRKIGSDDALAELVQGLRDPDLVVRGQAEGALAKLGARAVEAVMPLLQDDDLEVRGSAAFILGKIGEAAKPAVPALIEAAQCEDPSIRARIVSALRRIDPEAAAKIEVRR